MWSCYVYDHSQYPAPSILFYSSISDASEVKLISPSLKLEENGPGSLTFKILPNNIGYSWMKLMTAVITVKKDNKTFWRGRVIETKIDGYNQMDVTCEGLLNVLLDSVQLPMHANTSFGNWVRYLLIDNRVDPEDTTSQTHLCHNNQFVQNSIDGFKRIAGVTFASGVENVISGIDWYANYESTLDMINNALDAYEVKLKVYYDDTDSSGGTLMHFHFFKDYEITESSQTIRFGENLINYTRNFKIEELATVIIPRGKTVDQSETTDGDGNTTANVERPAYPYTPEDLDAYHTIADSNNPNGYYSNANAIAKYGRIIKVVDWNDIEEKANLQDLAQDYFNKMDLDNLTLEIEVFDLSLLMTPSEREAFEFHLYGTVRCVSKPHNLDKIFPITEVEYQFNNPENTKFTLGTDKEDSASKQNASSSSALQGEITNSKFQSAPFRTKLLAQAYEEAEALGQQILSQATANATTIMNAYATTGSVHFERLASDKSVVTSIVIADRSNYTASNAKLWRWNLGGLAFSTDGGRTYSNAAITNDGYIIGNFIKAGTLDAGKITTGILTGGTNQNTTFNLNNGRIFSKDLTFESTNEPETDSYMFMSSSTWNNRSAFASSFPNGINVGGYIANSWRLAVGRHFGVTGSGTLVADSAFLGGLAEKEFHRLVPTTITPNEVTTNNFVYLRCNFNVRDLDGRPFPALSTFSLQIRWRYKYDLTNPSWDQAASKNCWTTGWNAIAVNEGLYNVSLNIPGNPFGQSYTMNFTKAQMMDTTASNWQSHWMIEYRLISDGGEFSSALNNTFGLTSYGNFEEDISSISNYRFLLRKGYILGGSQPGGANSVFISCRDTGEIYGTDNTSGGKISIASSGDRTDWRMTIDSNFGVTADGRIFSNWGTFRNATVDGTISIGNANTPNVSYGSNLINLNGAKVNDNDGTVYTKKIQVECYGVRIKYGDNHIIAKVRAWVSDNGGDISSRLSGNTTIYFWFVAWKMNMDIYDPPKPTNIGKQAFDGNTYTVQGIEFNSQTASAYPADYFVPGNCEKIVSSTIMQSITVPANGSQVTIEIDTGVQRLYFPEDRDGTRRNCVCPAIYINENYSANKKANVSIAGTIYLGYDSVNVTYTPSGTAHNAVYVNDSFVSASSNGLLGAVGHYWKKAFIGTSVYTSSRIYKKDIRDFSDEYEVFFNNLLPRLYRRKEEDLEGVHSGFVVDEVEQAMNTADISRDGFAGCQIFSGDSPYGDGGLIYNEFIALNTWQIQKAKQRISRLEERIAILEEGVRNVGS